MKEIIMNYDRIKKWSQIYNEKKRSAEDAIWQIKSGTKLAVAMAVGAPPALLKMLSKAILDERLQNMMIYYKLPLAHVEKTLLQVEVAKRATLNTVFIMPADRELLNKGIAKGKKFVNFIPCHFSQLPKTLSEIIGIDTMIVTVSPMDKGGFFSLGTNNDFASVVARSCKNLIVEVNENMPRVFGQSLMHVTEVSSIVENNVPLISIPRSQASPAQEKIAEHVAELVSDGDTIQLGLGSIAEAVTKKLSSFKDLGVHSELLSSSITDLIKIGAVTGSKKTLHPNKVVFTVAMGDDDFYNYINDNAMMESYPASYVNDPHIIAKNDNFVSINSAINVDLYGQINAEFMDGHEYSGCGGHLDFIRGAFYSKNGKSIIAMPTTAKGGKVSKIVSS
jgi:itaconate CoA-transferase